MTEQTDAAEVEALTQLIWGCSFGDLVAGHDEARATCGRVSDWLAAREAAARAEALREAAEDCHDEARWCEEQEMRGKPQNAVDRVLALEKVFRERSRVIARTDGAGS